MEKEIKNLKTKYLSTTPPEFLETKGLDDLWRRVDSRNHFQMFHFSKFIVVLVFVFAILITSLGVATASAHPGMPFYPIKKLTQEVVKAISEIKPFKRPTPTPQPSPTPSATPTVAPELQKKQPEDQNQKQDTQNNSDVQKEVKGIHTSEAVSNPSNSGNEKSVKTENKDAQNGGTGNEKNKNNGRDNENNQQSKQDKHPKNN